MPPLSAAPTFDKKPPVADRRMGRPPNRRLSLAKLGLIDCTAAQTGVSDVEIQSILGVTSGQWSSIRSGRRGPSDGQRQQLTSFLSARQPWKPGSFTLPGQIPEALFDKTKSHQDMSADGRRPEAHMVSDKLVLVGKLNVEPNLLPRLTPSERFGHVVAAGAHNKQKRGHDDEEDGDDALDFERAFLNFIDQCDDDEMPDCDVLESQWLEARLSQQQPPKPPVIHRRRLQIQDADGRAQEIELRTSPFEWAYKRPGNMRFRAHVDVVHVPTNALVGRLSYGPSLVWCPEHRSRTAGPRARCALCFLPNDEWRDCYLCRRASHDSCPTCVASQARKPELRVEVMGKGCVLGLHASLLDVLFWNFAEPSTAKLDEFHVALDVPLDARLTLATFRPDGDTKPRSFKAYSNSDTGRGLELGAGPLRMVTYDKAAQIERSYQGRDVFVCPQHIHRGEAWTRLELRVRPNMQWPDVDLPTQLANAMAIWNDVVLLDLRPVDPEAFDGMLVLCARYYGHAPTPPTATTIAAARSDHNFATCVAHRVEDRRRKRTDALKLARAVHEATTRVLGSSGLRSTTTPA